VNIVIVTDRSIGLVHDVFYVDYAAVAQKFMMHVGLLQFNENSVFIKLQYMIIPL